MKLNPAGAVPCLHLNEDQVIPESLIICDYLDSVYPQNKLTSSDPYKNAMDKLLVERFSKVIGFFYKFLRNTEPNADKGIADSLEEIIENKLNSSDIKH